VTSAVDAKLVELLVFMHVLRVVSNCVFRHVSGQVKAAFTRSYNKTVHLTPYSTGAAAKKRGRQAAGAEEDVDDAYNEIEQADVQGRDDDDNNSDDDVSTDRMIVVMALCMFA